MHSSGPVTRTTRCTACLDAAIKILNEPEPLVARQKATTAKKKRKGPPTDADLAKEPKRIEKLRLARLCQNQQELDAERDKAFFHPVSAGSAVSVQFIAASG